MVLRTKEFSFKERTKQEEKHIVESIKNADKNSEFYKKVRNLIDKPDEMIIQSLSYFQENSYGMLLAKKEKEIIGHMAYQEHKISENEKEWRMFQCYIEPIHRKKGYAHFLTNKFIENALEKYVSKIKFSKGGHESMKHLLINLKEKGYDIDLENHLINLENIYPIKKEFPGIETKKEVLYGKSNNFEINPEPNFIRSNFPGFVSL